MFMLYVVVMGGSAGILFGDAREHRSRFGRNLRYSLSVALLILGASVGSFIK